MCEQGVQVNATEQGTQGGLRNLAGGNRVILNLKDGVLGVGHAEEDHGVHTGRNVVLGDDFLRGNGQGDDTHINALQGVNEGEDDVQAGLQLRTQVAEAEGDATFVFGDDAEHTNQNKKNNDGNWDEDSCQSDGIHGFPSQVLGEDGMCAHLPAPRTVQVVGVCSRGCPVPGCVWEFGRGIFRSGGMRWSAPRRHPAGKLTREIHTG